MDDETMEEVMAEDRARKATEEARAAEDLGLEVQGAPRPSF